MKTTPCPNAQPAPIGQLGIGHPRMPVIDYFPGETISEWLARHGTEPKDGRGVSGWLHIEEPLT